MTASREKLESEKILDMVFSDVRFLDSLLRMQAEHNVLTRQKESLPAIRETIIRIQQTLEHVYVAEWDRIMALLEERRNKPESIREKGKRLGINVTENSPDQMAALTGQPTSHFDWEEFNRRQEEQKREACARGEHWYGPGSCGGGFIYFKCQHCGHIEKKEDASFGAGK